MSNRDKLVAIRKIIRDELTKAVQASVKGEKLKSFGYNDLDSLTAERILGVLYSKVFDIIEGRSLLKEVRELIKRRKGIKTDV